MPAMRSATPTASWCSRGRTWLLAWLVGGVFAGAASAQSDAAAAEPAAQLPRTEVDNVVVQAAEDDSADARDLVPAKPADPVAAGEQLLKSSISAYGARSTQTAEAHLDLANAQREAKQFDKAAESYLAAVDAYRSVDGP